MAKQPSEEVLQERRDILRARGVPEAFIEDIATRRNYLIPPNFTAMAIVLTSIGLAYLLVSNLIERFPVWIEIYVEQNGLNVNARLFSYSNIQELAFIILMLALMCAPSWLWLYINRRVAPHPAPNETATALREPANSQIEYWVQTYAQDRALTAKDERAFLEGSAKGSLVVTAWLCLVPLGLSAAVFVMGHEDYWGLYGDRLTTHGLGHSKTRNLTEAISVTVGCNHTDDSEMLKYKLQFTDGSVDLEDGDFGLREAEFLTRLEAVNEQLRASSNIRFERWKWLNRDPMAPDCLSYWENVAGEDGKARVARLLAVP